MRRSAAENAFCRAIMRANQAPVEHNMFTNKMLCADGKPKGVAGDFSRHFYFLLRIIFVCKRNIQLIGSKRGKPVKRSEIKALSKAFSAEVKPYFRRDGI